MSTLVSQTVRSQQPQGGSQLDLVTRSEDTEGSDRSDNSGEEDWIPSFIRPWPSSTIQDEPEEEERWASLARHALHSWMNENPY